MLPLHLSACSHPHHLRGGLASTALITHGLRHHESAEMFLRASFTLLVECKRFALNSTSCLASESFISVRWLHTVKCRYNEIGYNEEIEIPLESPSLLSPRNLCNFFLRGKNCPFSDLTKEVRQCTTRGKSRFFSVGCSAFISDDDE